MKVAKNIWLINILCFLFTLNITAQTGKLFNTENQLSSSFANQVFQARNGFIWIATRNGINVYDGYNFTLLRRDFEDNRGLSNNYINCIDEDHEGNILLGTSNSLIEYNGRGFQVVPMYDSKGKEARTYINHMTIKRFEKMLERLAIVPEYYHATPLRPWLAPLAKTTACREYLSKMVTCVILKK